VGDDLSPIIQYERNFEASYQVGADLINILVSRVVKSVFEENIIFQAIVENEEYLK
jgi:hypothetical protein